MYPIYYPYYMRMYPYRTYPYYPYHYPYIGSQSSTINQQIYNAGYMAGVSQVAYSNNYRF